MKIGDKKKGILIARKVGSNHWDVCVPYGFEVRTPQPVRIIHAFEERREDSSGDSESGFV